MKSAETNEFDYNRHVKEKLVQWRDAFEYENNAKINYSAIAKRMEADFGITTSTQKISAMFDISSKREVKLQEIVALSQMFHFPLLDIVEYPATPSNSMNLSSLCKKTGNTSSISPLSNNYYEGDYYGYCFSPKYFYDHIKPVEENSLEEVHIHIAIQNGHTTITYEELKASTSFYGKKQKSFTLTGDLYLLENNNIAYSFLTESTGRRSMALMFSYLNLATDIRYYITAALLRFSYNQVSEPLMQKMAIFRVRQDINDAKSTSLIRGILALDSQPIILDEETMYKLMQEDEIYAKVLGPEKALTPCYAFSETAVRSNMFFLHNENEKMRRILELRKHSLAPANQIVSESDDFAVFIRKYQMDQMKD